MKLEIRSPIGTPKYEGPPDFYGAKLGSSIKKEQSSSQTSSRNRGGLASAQNDRIYPRIEFWKRHEYYLTIGRVQNVTESYVLNIINREWYYDSAEEGRDLEDKIKLMEDWEEKVVVTNFLGNLVRSWIVDGLHVISPKDWIPLQLQSIRSKKRDKFGKTLFYYQIIDGVEKPIDAAKFIEVPYIDFDREAWPTGMFDSLMNNEYIDVDGRDARASLELYRQALQDNMKIHHKFASPRVIYTAEGVGKQVMDNDVIPLVEGMKAGDRAAINRKIEIVQESVDGNARFIEHVNKIVDEIDTGLQSSANRLITEPSAMADAREANSQDDDRVLGIMEKIRIFMNREVIPRITGLQPGEIEFKWGAKDAFDLELPEPIEKAINLGILTPEKAMVLLEEQYHWKIPTDEDVKEKIGITPAKQPDMQEPQQDPKEAARQIVAEAVKELAVNFESHPSGELEREQIENIKTEKRLKNEKLVFISSLNNKLNEVVS